MPAIVKHERDEMLQRIFDHWDAKEELCAEETEWWMAQTNAFRKEARHNYEFEADA